MNIVDILHSARNFLVKWQDGIGEEEYDPFDIVPFQPEDYNQSEDEDEDNEDSDTDTVIYEYDDCVSELDAETRTITDGSDDIYIYYYLQDEKETTTNKYSRYLWWLITFAFTAFKSS